MLIFAHPFRLVGGRIATVDDGSDEGLAQQIAVLVTTRRGERPLVPAFGVSDPAFDGLDVAEINAGLAMFGPDVSITSIETEVVDAANVRATLTWQDNSSSGDS